MQSGPYRLIRHPGYLGTLLFWIGLPLALANWIALLLVMLLMVVAYGLTGGGCPGTRLWPGGGRLPSRVRM